MSELIHNSGGRLPVYLRDLTGEPIEGVPFDAVGLGLWYCKADSVVPVDIELTATNWIELRSGHYRVPVGPDVADVVGELHFHCSLPDAEDYPGVVDVVVPERGDGDVLHTFYVTDLGGNPASGVHVACYRVDGQRLIYMGTQISLADGSTSWMIFRGVDYHYYCQDPDLVRRLVFAGPEIERL